MPEHPVEAAERRVERPELLSEGNMVAAAERDILRILLAACNRPPDVPLVD